MLIRNDTSKNNEKELNSVIRILKLRNATTKSKSNTELVQNALTKDKRVGFICDDYKKYLQENIQNNALIVDTATSRFSSQQLL